MAKKTKDSNLSIEERLEQALIPNWDEPYKLPENWCWVNLGSLGSLGMGQTILSKDLKEEGIPVYSATEENKIFGYISESENTTKLCSGDIVIPARGNSIGHVKYVSCNEASCTQTTMFFKPFDKAIGKYVYYYMLGNKHKLFAYHGNAIPQITITNIIKKEIPLPPLEEQLRMVERIEILFDKLDEAKEKAQAVVDGFETRKAAILHKAFSGELTAKWRTIHSDQIGEIDTTPLDKIYDNYDLPYTLPKSWRWVRFNECCTFVGSGVTPKGGKEVYQLHGVPFIRSQNVLKGALDLSDVAYISPEIDNLMKRTRILGGETLFNITGASIGRSCFVPVSQTIGNVNQHVCIIRYKNYIKPELPQFWLNSPYVQAFVVENQVGQTRQALNFKQIRGMYYPLAPISEQAEMVRILENLLAKEQQAKEAAEAVIEQIDTMKKAILARAFRGELGTNDPSEESAVELLKQII